MGFIQEHLVAHKELKEIEYAAVNGLLSTLDPHTNLLEPKYFKEMKLQTRGEFGGLGFVIAMRDGNLTVVKVLKNTPAQRAGIKAKDVIARIEEQSTVNMDLQDAVDRLRGKPQTKISITVQRKGGRAEASSASCARSSTSRRSPRRSCSRATSATSGSRSSPPTRRATSSARSRRSARRRAASSRGSSSTCAGTPAACSSRRSRSRTSSSRRASS